MKHIAPIALASLGMLCACARSAAQPAETAAAAPPPAPAASGSAMDISKPITALGTEPFWSLKIEGMRFRLSRPSQPDLTAEAPGAQMSPGRAVWEAKAADGQTLKVTIYNGDCSDGMSDRRYPMAAEIQLGQETLRGCAAPA